MGIPGSPYSRDFGGPRRDYRDPLLPATGSTERHRRTILVQCCLQLFALPTVPRRSVNLLGCFQTKKLLPLLPKEVTSPWVLPKEVLSFPQRCQVKIGTPESKHPGCLFSHKYRHPDAYIYVNMGNPSVPFRTASRRQKGVSGLASLKLAKTISAA